VGQVETRITKKIVARVRTDYPDSFIFKVMGGAFTTAGIPDLIWILQGRFIGLEVKVPGNTASKIQVYVHSLIRRAGGIVGVVYSYADVLELIGDLGK
jgi:hypothetical protein